MVQQVVSPAEYKLERDWAKVNQKLELCERNIAYCEMVKSEVLGAAYSKDIHDKIKARSEEMQKKFGYFRSAMLQASKKELIETIVKFCDHTIAIEQERMMELNAKLSEIESLKNELERINARIENVKAHQK